VELLEEWGRNSSWRGKKKGENEEMEGINEKK
jgi:hypothetical protein